MTSLREQLDGKARRRCVVPVPVRDPGPARQRHEAAVLAVAAASGAPEDARPTAMEAAGAELDAATAELAACTVDITLAAPSAADAEAVQSRHLGDDGGVDYTAALPDLLALCAEDESLRDADWWREALARPEWGPSEVAGLRLGVLYLVADPIRPLLPKG